MTTARVVISDIAIADTAVMSFNDWTNGLVGGLPEFEYDTAHTIIGHRKGASLWGWATSVPTPLGNTWTYRGKIHAPGWTVSVDPSIATDPNSEHLVYMAQLAISDAAFDAFAGGDYLYTPGDYVDGFCAGRWDATVPNLSPTVACRKVYPEPVSPSYLDKTAIAVDWEGRVWVALEDLNRTHPDPAETQQGVVRIFRSDSATSWSTFSEVVIPQSVASFIGNREPRLKAVNADDPLSDGNIFLESIEARAAEPNGVPELRVLSLWQDLSGFAGFVVNDLAGCDLSRMKKGILTPSTVIGLGNTQRSIKNAYRHDFDVGWDHDGAAVYRAAFQYVDDGGDDRIQVVETQDFQNCTQSPWLSTEALLFGDANIGQQFQPALDFHPRITPTNFPFEWQMAHLSTTFAVDLAEKYVAPWGATIYNRTVGGVPVPSFTWLVPLVPSSLTDNGTALTWYACLREDGYWGDYFGLSQVWNPLVAIPPPLGTGLPGTWQNVAGFTSSVPAAPPGVLFDCVWETAALGSPQHVVATTWLSADVVP